MFKTSSCSAWVFIVLQPTSTEETVTVYVYHTVCNDTSQQHKHTMQAMP